MSIVTTCGHAVSSIDDLFDLQLKGHEYDGTPCVVYGCYCECCAQDHADRGMVISTLAEQESWLATNSISRKYDLISEALALMHHADPRISEFAKQVHDHLNSPKDPRVVVCINTAEAFTLLLNDTSSITGMGTIEFRSVDDAIVALNGASITWVRPIKVHTPDGEYRVDFDDVDHYSFFIQYCYGAALALLDGNTSFTKVDGAFSISVELK